MKYRVRKLIAAVLTMSMVLSVPVFATDGAVELTEERKAFLEESGNGATVIPDSVNVSEAPDMADAIDSDSPIKDYKEPEYYNTTSMRSFSQNGYTLKINYTDVVPYDGKSHVAYSTKGKSKSKQKDLYISASGTITNFATVSYSYKYNKNVADSNAKKAPRIKISLKAKKKATKQQKKIVKALNKTLKKSKNQLKFTIAPLDVSVLDPVVKYSNSAHTKVKSISVKFHDKTLKLKAKDYKMGKYKDDSYIQFKGNYCGFYSENLWLNTGYKTVTFVTNCEDKVDEQRVKYGTVLSEPAVSKAKSELKGWFKNEAMTSTQQYYFSEGVTKNMTLYARWIKVEPDYMDLYASRSTVLNDNSDKSKVDFFLNTDVEVDSIDLERDGVKVATLKDNGQYNSSGDELAGDGIFTAKVSGSITSQGLAQFKAVYRTLSESNVVEIDYVNPFTQAEIEQMNAVNASIDNLVKNDAFKNGDVTARKNQANTLLEQNKNEGKINNIVDGSNMITFEYASGAKGGIPLEDFSESTGYKKNVVPIDVKEIIDDANEDEDISTDDETLESGMHETQSDEIGDMEEMEDPASADYVIPITPEPDKEELTLSEMPVNDASEDVNTAGDRHFYGKALILNSFPAFETEPDEIKYRTTFYRNLKSKWNGYGMTTTLIDNNVTVDDYKKFADYDVVDIATHGYADAYSPYICLAEKATDENKAKYALELKTGEIIEVDGNFWICPEFFTNEYVKGSLKKTFVFSESCMFMGHGKGSESALYDYKMANAIRNAGSPVVIGDHNSVFATYIREFMETYVDSLVDANTAYVSFTNAKNAKGADHEQWLISVSNYQTLKEWWDTLPADEKAATYVAEEEIAYPTFRGDPNAKLLSNELKNGDFEQVYSSGSITRPMEWGYDGDGRAVQKLGDAVPINPSSKWMGLVTSGIGSQEKTKITGMDGSATEGSRMFQTVKMSDSVSEMSFYYNFVSEEPMEFVGSRYDDTFAVVISQGDTVLYSNVFASVNTSTWYEIGGVDFEGGDQTAYETHWSKGAVDMTPYRGKTVTISFVVYDKGDKIYDSACLLDDVILK